MRAVARRPVFGLFAAAKSDARGALRRVRQRRERRRLVRAVAKRLIFAQAAGAPIIRLPGFDLDQIGRLLRDVGTVHIIHLSSRLKRSVRVSGRFSCGGQRKQGERAVAEQRLRNERHRPERWIFPAAMGVAEEEAGRAVHGDNGAE